MRVRGAGERQTATAETNGAQPLPSRVAMKAFGSSRLPGVENKTEADLREQLRSLLLHVRERTLTLLAPLSESDATTQHDPLMSPIVWDLGHVIAFERLWLQEQLERPVTFGEMPGVFNPFEHPRSERGKLELPSLRATLEELETVRAATLARMDDVSFDSASPLLYQGYVYRMVAQHESQHQETILQTLQLKRGEPYAAPRKWRVPDAPRAQSVSAGTMISFSGGEVSIGTDDQTAAYDNERPEHRVMLPPFEIATAPVTNAEYVAFMSDGGYDDEGLWSQSGLVWLREEGARAPKYWRKQGSQWVVRTMDRERPIDPLRPVVHVCYYEAEAYACWAGQRLPTENEWEAAARWDPRSQRARDYPWGDDPADRTLANVDQLGFDTAPFAAYERNVSPVGCYGMIGDVWEWTASDFTGYPGFRSFPYREYSEVFFGSEYKVLRGGSWATAAHVARSTFRNWDLPVRRQIFSGFRCARNS
jgi:iron(II)-dependent oxidoreductase